MIVKSKSLIDEILSKDLKNLDLQELKNLLDQLIEPKYKVLIVTLPPGTLIYRGVNYNVKPDKKEQLSYNPNIDSIKIGRANLDNDPIFYGGIPNGNVGGDAICSFEILKSEISNLNIWSKTIYLGEWILNRQLEIPFIGQIPSNESLGVLSELCNLKARFYTENTEESEENQIIDNFLSMEFTKPVVKEKEYQYKISACYSYLLRERFNSTGLLYPSVQTNFKGINVAISPFILEKGILQLRRVLETKYYVRLNRAINEYTLQGIPTDIGFDWKSLPSSFMAPNNYKNYYSGLSNDDSFINSFPFIDLN